eukprot:13005181-Alexandrium_andersonii.AAC.1
METCLIAMAKVRGTSEAEGSNEASHRPHQRSRRHGFTQRSPPRQTWPHTEVSSKTGMPHMCIACTKTDMA